jgi:hypothetical protein
MVIYLAVRGTEKDREDRGSQESAGDSGVHQKNKRLGSINHLRTFVGLADCYAWYKMVYAMPMKYSDWRIIWFITT